MNTIFRIKTFLVLVFAVFVVAINAQQVQFPVFSIYNGSLFNPAAFGREPVPEFFVTGRKMFVGFNGAPNFGLFSASAPLKKIPSVAGLTISSESKGIFGTTQVNGNYSYRLTISKECLVAFGVSVGYIRKSLSPGNAIVEMNNDPIVTSGNINTSGYFVNAGLSVSFPQFTAGFAIPNTTENELKFNYTSGKRSFYANARHFFASATYCTSSRPDETISLYFDLSSRFVKNAPFQFDGGVRVSYKEKVALGVYYRSGYAIGTMLRAELTNRIYAGYAYDYGLWSKKAFAGTSHEVLVGYRFKSKTKKSRAPVVKVIEGDLSLENRNGGDTALSALSEKEILLSDSLETLNRLNHGKAEYTLCNGVYIVTRNQNDFFFSNGNGSFSGYYLITATGYHYNQLLQNCPVVPDSVETTCDVVFDKYTHIFYLFDKRCYEQPEAIKMAKEYQQTTGTPVFVLRLKKEE